MEWSTLKQPHESSFEELCCQLAAVEPPQDGCRFQRKGRPDAGIECLWRFPTGEEWGWQAKWFPSSLTSAQWQQLDQSFETAFYAHPQLTKYFVCLPLDLPDGRRDSVITAQQRWEEWRSHWKAFAVAQGRTLEFELWGSHELTQRLTAPANRGACWYWFGQTALTSEWFERRRNQSVKTAGTRYIPELNIDTEAKRTFLGFRRTHRFWEAACELLRDLRHSSNTVWCNDEFPEAKNAILQLNVAYDALLVSFRLWASAGFLEERWTHTAALPTNEWSQLADSAMDAVYRAQAEFASIQRDELKKSERPSSRYAQLPFDDKLRALDKVGSRISTFQDFLLDIKCSCANSKAVALVGEAGSGKTHLLCDLLEEDLSAGRPSLLFFGEQFTTDEPWTQLIRLAGLSCDREEFLGGLQAAAQASGGLATIYIDALNEGSGGKLWSHHIAAFAEELCDRPWLRLCISVRDVYRSHVIPIDSERSFSFIHHSGFSEHTFEAATKFFRHFELEPAAPLLEPEFDNPLFLILLCRGLRDAGVRRIPLGMRGFTQVFKFLIRAVDEKLAAEDCLDYDKSELVVTRAIEALADAMFNRGTDQLLFSEAKSLLETILPSTGHSRSLLRHLEAESLVIVVPDWQGDAERQFVRFTYQRLSDYLFVQRLLQDVQPHSIGEVFKPKGALHKFIADEEAIWEFGGIVEALAILLPENTGVELIDVSPGVADSLSMRSAMYESLAWRDPIAVTDYTRKFIERSLPKKDEESSDELLNALVSLAPIPAHPLNADYLATLLEAADMPDRDSWWSTFLFRQCGRQKAVDRLVSWAWNQSHDWHGEEEVARLAGITLGWFLTCSHRRLRDSATKGLVRLHEERLGLLQQLLKRFEDVDDPYVSERLAAVAFGASARADDTAALIALGSYVYDRYFESGSPPTHLVERDYLRQTVELAIARSLPISVDTSLLRPPYNGEWPADGEIPSRDEVLSSQSRLYGEYIFGPYGDFSKYVTDFSEWRSTRLDGSPTRTPERELRAYSRLLTPLQKKAFSSFRAAHSRYRRLQREHRMSKAEAAAEKKFRSCQQAFVKTLRPGTAKHARYNAYLADYFEEPWVFSSERRINYHAARRWMSARVRDLGWSAPRFGRFDHSFRTDSDPVCVEESIGKKYCWIALAEMQAKLADTFCASSQWLEDEAALQGPWEVSYGRDIDPSILLASTRNQSLTHFNQTWWFDNPFDQWELPSDDVGWVSRTDNLPDPTAMIFTRDPSGNQWITMNGYYEWEQPTKPGHRHWELPVRNIWYRIAGYFVRSEDLSGFRKWTSKKKWRPDAMPDDDVRHSHVFWGELFWSDAYKHSIGTSGNPDGWTRGTWDELPVQVLAAVERYSMEHTASDASLVDSVSFYVPCSFFVTSLGLKIGKDGHWMDQGGRLVAFDPAIDAEGASALLVRRDALDEFLASNKLSLVWVVSGQRERSGGKNPHDEYVGHTDIRAVYRYHDGGAVGEPVYETKLRNWP
ncbi:MAG: hypothetical protein JNL18_23060 [Planctomycetaceae bacterium]|nr:hypothetical protein [Planctomycetaceae bacterium]